MNQVQLCSEFPPNSNDCMKWQTRKPINLSPIVEDFMFVQP